MMLTAILIGFVGSLHCVGMCSPLAAAVTSVSRRVILSKLLYNFGRILTYGAMGACVGAFGSIAVITPYQGLLSAGLGVALLLMGVAGVSSFRVPLLTRTMNLAAMRLRTMFTTLVKRKGGVSLVLLGCVNGLLPCGLTYLALAYCLSLPNAEQGFAFMTLFGLGTLPAMIGAPLVWRYLSARIPWTFQRTTMVVMILLGSLLLFRSLSMQIPSETQNLVQASEVMCP